MTGQHGSATAPRNDGALPAEYVVGQELDWRARFAKVHLEVELPFWLMTPDVSVTVRVNRHRFRIDLRDGWIQRHAQRYRDSWKSCVYVGPPGQPLAPDLQLEVDAGLHVMSRKAKTVLRVATRCNEDVIRALTDDRARLADLYLKALCEAHLPVVNALVGAYRLATYDYFAYEVSPWDVPVWFLIAENGFARVSLFDYANWDDKPSIIDRGGIAKPYQLATGRDLRRFLDYQPSAGEIELLDAINLVERGDYSGGVRRIVTAIEAATEESLRAELVPRLGAAKAERRLDASSTDFPGRLRQYEKLSSRRLAPELRNHLDRSRTTRHGIVHRGTRITFADRGEAHRAVDTGRWIFNWLENNAGRAASRERRIGMRSLGRHMSLFGADINRNGVTVRPPRPPARHRSP